MGNILNEEKTVTNPNTVNKTQLIIFTLFVNAFIFTALVLRNYFLDQMAALIIQVSLFISYLIVDGMVGHKINSGSKKYPKAYLMYISLLSLLAHVLGYFVYQGIAALL